MQKENNTLTAKNVQEQTIWSWYLINAMMVYFCHHLWDSYVNLSDLNADFKIFMLTFQLFIFKNIALKVLMPS